MRRPEYIAKQARHPSGILGSLLARVMAVETAYENALALELLKIQPADHVLEIGYGHGRTIARAAQAAHAGFVAGIDWSERMLRVATRHNHRLIAQGRVALEHCASNKLPYPDHRFDKAYSVHTVYFWKDPVEDLREIGRVLKPRANFVLAFRPKEENIAKDFPESAYKHYTPQEICNLLKHAAFDGARIVDRTISGRAVCFALARRVD
jgi:ubiquinone/menaquinone biosynthesis C-methylase UbiE